MASLTGMLNGTAVLLYMFDPALGTAGEWVILAGQVTNDQATEVALLDMSNKDSGGVQEFLEGEGMQSISDTVAFVFNTEASFKALQTAHRTKAIRRFLFARGNLELGGGTDIFEGMVPTFNDSAANETLFTATATIQSANDEKLFFGVLFNDAIDSNSDDAIDAAGNAAVARA